MQSKAAKHPVTCARRRRQQLVPRDRDLAPEELARLAQQIADCCGITMLKAHRLARGWTAQQAVDELHHMVARLGLSAQRLSRTQLAHFESGRRPGDAYRDLLCRLYRTGPVQLGWCVDYSASSVEDEHPRSASTATHEEADDMKRRNALRALVGAGGLGLSTGWLDRVDGIRAAADQHLNSTTVSPTVLDRWEVTVAGHGFAFKHRPPAELLADVLLDFAELARHMRHRQTSEHLTRLCRALAMTAGLIGNLLTDLGHHRQARGWFATAGSAADETRDRTLASWVRAREATLHLYHGRPPQTALALATEAAARAGRTACTGAALAASTEARAWARLGVPTRALAALDRAERISGQLDADGRANSIFGYPYRQLVFHREATLTLAGKVDDARAAQKEALALYPASEHVNPTLIRLDGSMCLVAAGDTAGGCDTATKYLLGVPDSYRTPLVLSRAREILDRIPVAHHDAKPVRNYRALVRELSATRPAPAL